MFPNKRFGQLSPGTQSRRCELAAAGRMAMSTDFLDAFARLPGSQQRGVRSLIAKFEANPRAPALHYEPVRSAKDPRIRSLRVDQDYRAIVLRPKTGDTHVLLWADKHDRAYEWASRHKCDVNPETGALQIYSPADHPNLVPDAAYQEARSGANGPFARLKYRQLVRLGVPGAMVPEIHAARGEQDLEEMKGRLPEEAYEGLFYYLAGEAYEKIIRDRDASLRRTPSTLTT